MAQFNQKLRSKQREIARRVFFGLLLATASLLFVTGCAATDANNSTSDGVELGPEYTEHYRGSDPTFDSSESKLASMLLWYLPNRMFDAWDIFRADVGVGVSAGGVLRITEYGQAGYRSISPFSVRIGPRGRSVPFFVEQSDEYGFGPGFVSSEDRIVTPAEIGVGLDVVLVGAYAGVSVDEVFDFVLGFLFIDFKDDDIQ